MDVNWNTNTHTTEKIKTHLNLSYGGFNVACRQTRVGKDSEAFCCDALQQRSQTLTFKLTEGESVLSCCVHESTHCVHWAKWLITHVNPAAPFPVTFSVPALLKIQHSYSTSVFLLSPLQAACCCRTSRCWLCTGAATPQQGAPALCLSCSVLVALQAARPSSRRWSSVRTKAGMEWMFRWGRRCRARAERHVMYELC